MKSSHSRRKEGKESGIKFEWNGADIFIIISWKLVHYFLEIELDSVIENFWQSQERVR